MNDTNSLSIAIRMIGQPLQACTHRSRAHYWSNLRLTDPWCMCKLSWRRAVRCSGKRFISASLYHVSMSSRNSIAEVPWMSMTSNIFYLNLRLAAFGSDPPASSCISVLCACYSKQTFTQQRTFAVASCTNPCRFTRCSLESLIAVKGTFAQPGT